MSLLDKCWWHIPFQDLVFCCLHSLFSNLQEKEVILKIQNFTVNPRLKQILK